VRIVLTLAVRDEADIIEANIRYHLDAGVDFIVATDHRSTDGTTEILRDYERDGLLHLIRQHDEAFLQTEWVNGMARLAAACFGADWVINADADEFWWPHSGTLHDVFAAVPARYGAIRGIWRHFVLRPDDPAAFSRTDGRPARTGPGPGRPLLCKRKGRASRRSERPRQSRQSRRVR